MTRGTRTRLSTGIYRDAHGIAIVISVQGRPKEFRYHGKDLEWLRRERQRLKDKESLKVTRRAAKDETFDADIERYLRTISSPSHLRNASGLLKHWSAAFGDERRDDITPMAVQTQFAKWDGKAASTRNHLRHVLIAFYAALNGPQGYNPARVLRKVKERYDDARALPYATIERIFNALEPSRSKARLMVMAYTGLPQAQIARLQPHDINLPRKQVYVRPRRKGAGVPGKMLPLSASGVTAFKLFIEQHAFGSFQRRQLQRAFANGITWSGVTVPTGTRPYDLRHSFLTEVYRQTGDLNAVAELGMHATLEQTARYARGAVSERAKLAVARVPRIPKRGTTPKSSNSLELPPPDGRAGKGSNQYRQRPKSRDSQRETD